MLDNPVPVAYLDETDAERNQVSSTPDASQTTMKQDTASTIAQLVVSYLQYHGYESTASALLQEQQATQSHYADLLPSPTAQSTANTEVHASTSVPNGSSSFHQNSARQAICRLIMSGAIGAAVERIREDFPRILEDDNSIDSLLFQLRCLEYIELVVLAVSTEPGTTQEVLSASSMDVDADAPPVQSVSPVNASIKSYKATQKQRAIAVDEDQSEALLEAALTAGQNLHATYAKSTDARIQTMLQHLFGLMAYVNPHKSDSEFAQHIMADYGDDGEHSSRKNLASLTNSAIMRMWNKVLRCAYS